MGNDPIEDARRAINDVERYIDFLLKRISELEEELRIAENRNEDLDLHNNELVHFIDSHGMSDKWTAHLVAIRMG
jgi:ribosome assembly protein YihI (activator of Der GTPase)